MVLFLSRLKGRYRGLRGTVARAPAGLRQAIASSSWLLAAKLLRTALAILVGIQVARYLGPGAFGILNYAISFAALLGPLYHLGLDRIMVRELVARPNEQGVLLGTALCLKLCSGFVAFLLLVAAALSVQHDMITRLAILIVGAGQLFAVFDVPIYWFQSKVASKFVAIAQSSALLVVCLLLVLLIIHDAPLLYVVGAYASETPLSVAFLYFLYRSQGQSLSARCASLQRAGTLLRESWPLLIGGFATIVYARIDQVMLGGLHSPTEVGWYSAAVRISEVWWVLGGTIGISVFPAIVRAKQHSDALYRERLQYFYDGMVWIGLTIAGVMVVIAQPLAVLLYGDAYAPAGAILQVHAWAVVFVGMGAAQHNWLIAEGLTRFSAFTTVLGALANIGLNLLLIPRYGGLGAAWATVVSHGLASYVSCFLYAPAMRGGTMATLALLAPARYAARWAADGRPFQR